MSRLICTFAAALFTLVAPLMSFAADAPHDHDQPIPSLTVTGTGDVSVAPDRAVVRLGATVQSEQAAAAQDQVNRIVQKALDQIKALGVPAEKITTVGLTLNPVYTDPQPISSGGHREPRIVGYRASNILSVELEDLGKVGTVIDAGVSAGANQIHGISFELQNDGPQRRQALRSAVMEARGKASAIAEAAGVRLVRILEADESGVTVIRPHGEMMMRSMAMAAGAPTPVQPGQVRVEATVMIRYQVEPAPATERSE